MSGRILSFLGLFMAAMVSVALPAQAQPVPLTAYGENAGVEEASISPTGKHLAMVATVNGQRQVIVLDDNLKPITRIGATGIKVRGLQWLGDDAVILIASQTEKLDMQIFKNDKSEFLTGTLIPVDGSAPQAIFSNRRDLVNAIQGNYGVRKVDGKWQAYLGAIVLKPIGISKRGQFMFDHGRPFLHAVDVSNKADLVARPGDERWSRDWLVDENGKVVATMDVDVNTGEWSIDGPRATDIVKGKQETGAAWLVGISNDGREIIYGERHNETQEDIWYAIPLDGGTPREFLADSSVRRTYMDRTTGRMLGYREMGYSGKSVFFDPARQAAVRKIEAAFKGLDLSVESFTPDLSKAIVKTTGSKDSGTWYLVDTVNLGAKAIGYDHIAIGPDKVGPISVFGYKARDGMDMDGILTLPPGGAAKNLPLVVLPHGGPQSYDTPSFDWWAQAYASRGYAVFQPNFRGSTNRDDAFREAGRGEWGGKMQTDITDGVEALAAKGIVDPKRACIVGASYGGFAALAGVTLEQGRYKCAVAVAPVVDMGALYSDARYDSNNGRLTKTYFMRQFGPENTWDARSPLRNAAKADAPVLLIHGKDDIVVPVTHTDRMADALKDAGKTVQVIKMRDEDHWLSSQETRQQMLDAAVAWVLKYNPPS